MGGRGRATAPLRHFEQTNLFICVNSKNSTPYLVLVDLTKQGVRGLGGLGVLGGLGRHREGQRKLHYVQSQMSFH